VGNARETEVDPTTTNVLDSSQLRPEAMRKPKKLWKVGDLARFVGISRQAIHNYTLLGLIQEADRTPGGQRLFDDEAFARLQKIERLKAKGLTLTQIAAQLNRPKTTRPRRSESGATQQEEKGENHADEQES
jgi:DNA-binding transcriptional MerR regulator